MTNDAEQEVHNLLKKSVNRLHAVKDDLRYLVDVLGGDDPWHPDGVALRAVSGNLVNTIDGLNRYVAMREEVNV